jgi:hypothetical protein
MPQGQQGRRSWLAFDAARSDLLAVMNQAVEPAHVSVWIASHGPGPS